MAFFPQHCGSRSTPFSNRRSKARTQIGDEVAQMQFRGDLRGLGDHQVDPVGQSLAQGGPGGIGRGIAEQVEVFDLLFDLAGHIPRIPG